MIMFTKFGKPLHTEKYIMFRTIPQILIIINLFLYIFILIFRLLCIIPYIIHYNYWTCDHDDPVLNMDMRGYFLGIIVLTLLSFIEISYISDQIVKRETRASDFQRLQIFHLAALIFSIIWFIIGGVIIFRSNMECIYRGEGEIIIILVIWGTSIFEIFNYGERVFNNKRLVTTYTEIN